MVDMEILTMVVTNTQMITKPLTMDMANMTMLLAMQKPPHGYPRIYPEYQNQYNVNLSRSTPQSSYMQDHARSDDDHRNFLAPENEYQVPTTTFPSGSYSIKDKERQSQDFVQSKERQYQDTVIEAYDNLRASTEKYPDVDDYLLLTWMPHMAHFVKVLRSLKKEAEDDLFYLVSRKTSISRRTSIPTQRLTITNKKVFNKKISPTSYETVAQGSSIKPMTEHEELMGYTPQPLQRLIENIDNPPKDGGFGYTCVACSSGQGRWISTAELIRKHLSAEFKKDKKMYEMIGGKNIDEDIRNTQAGKSAGVADWLKMPLFGSYSGYPPFCMAFVDTNHYVVLHFKKVNGSIPAPPIDGWWLRKSSSRNKQVWLQSLETDLKLFQKLMPSASGGAVINVD
ncbi:hypothetical protein PPACK8108_LOCUS8718 [Phakopsora pachyrhizi]|uniref:Uncharacterized protein n=1 Tax=Phakopsora pachyrhizi TaxID=170000 RepID=A0AAV0AXL6_PHAPC|nr:hypothetical protein PPACK8108_LOCUS8718 [Phakopsora pachyrhizi]